jgi:hypothetical protein
MQNFTEHIKKHMFCLVAVLSHSAVFFKNMETSFRAIKPYLISDAQMQG